MNLNLWGLFPLSAVLLFIGFNGWYMRKHEKIFRKRYDQFRVDTTPANFSFAIWSLIYLVVLVITGMNCFDEYAVLPTGLSTAAFVVPLLWSPAFKNEMFVLSTLVLWTSTVLTLVTFFYVEEDSEIYIYQGIALYGGWLSSASLLSTFALGQIILKHEALNEMLVLDVFCFHFFFVVLSDSETLYRALAFHLVGIWTLVGIHYRCRQNYTLLAAVGMAVVVGIAVVRVLNDEE